MIFAQGFMLGVGVGIIFASSVVLLALALFAIEDAYAEESARVATRASTPTPKPKPLTWN